MAGDEMNVKAFHCASDFYDWYGCHLLVFAETAGKAKAIALKDGPWDYDGFLDVKVQRAKAWDGMISKPCVIETNYDISQGYPDFYSDEEDYPDPDFAEASA
jgi:hypothetical protein